MEYRCEWKYLVDAQTAARVRFLMARMLTPDPHAAAGAGYRVESLYFDDWNDTALHENLAGVDERQKFRLRRYGQGAALRLEDKQKLRGYTRKESCAVSAAEGRAISALGGRMPEAAFDPARPVLNRLLAARRTRRLLPVVSVIYDRTAFVGRAGNVRVTLDSDIRAAAPPHFWQGGASLPVLLAGQEILEIKFDEFLPQTLAETLELGQMQQTAFSKYTLCRGILPAAWQRKDIFDQ